MRLIDANALMKNIGKIPQLRGITYGRMKKAVEETPTIDAELVRHGRWEWYVNMGCTAHLEPIEPYDAGWGCSACGIDLVQYLRSHFPDIPSYLECACEEKPTLERCPNCGAKMDGGDPDGV